MDYSFAGKAAIVTGAAHGFGRAICQQLAQRSARVWACDVLEDELAETARLCRAQGGDCEARRVDVTREDDARSCAEAVVAAAGRVDILVNCAGGVLGQVGQPVEMSASPTGIASWP